MTTRSIPAIALAIGVIGTTTQAGTCPDLNPLDSGLPTPLVISEINPDDYIELFNTTEADIDLGVENFWLFARPTEVDLRVLAPTTIVPAGGYATVPFPASFIDSDNGGEIVLYRDISGSADFFNGNLLVDFVCWGTVPHLSVKVIAEAFDKWSGACAGALVNGAISRLPSTDGTTLDSYDVTAEPSPLNCSPGPGGTGACCATNGTCSVITEDDCLAAGGAYFGDDSVCLGDSNRDGFDDLCVTPTGACCAAADTCSVETEDDCLAGGGTYFGDDSVCLGDSNSDGFDDLCVTPTGACCATAGTCSVETEADCLAGGGTYFGDDSVCLGDSNSDGFDDLCVTPTGACCATAGTCSVETEADCLAGGGTYFGDDSVCLGDSNRDGFDDLCVTPPDTGACCATDDTCSLLSLADCLAGGGAYFGDGTACLGDSNSDGFDDLCVTPTGACCATAGTCSILTEAECLGGIGTYFGDDTVCLGDSNSDGFDDLCVTPPNTGACCATDDTCSTETEADCLSGGGTYFGDDSVCLGDSNTDGFDDLCVPPTGTEACCFTGGKCTDAEPVACASSGGVSQGPCSTCDTVACPTEGCPGAGGSCSEPNGTPGCDDVACCTLVCDIDGFCCDVEWDGVCVGLAEDCQVQACCFFETGDCLDITGFECNAMLGIPFDPGTSCATVICPNLPEPCPNLNPIPDGSGLPSPMLISEINPGDYVELYNITDTDIELSVENFWLCSPFLYADLRVIAAGTIVPAGGYATVPWSKSFPATDAGGEIILYRDIGTLLDFGTGDLIVDFVCWGVNPGNSRKALAESVGRWSGDCAAALSAGAISRLAGDAGDGTTEASYDTDATPEPTNCVPNPVDVNGNGCVEVGDLIEIIISWGPCVGCLADTNGDGVVNVTDLVGVITGWQSDCLFSG